MKSPQPFSHTLRTLCQKNPNGPPENRAGVGRDARHASPLRQGPGASAAQQNPQLAASGHFSGHDPSSSSTAHPGAAEAAANFGNNQHFGMILPPGAVAGGGMGSLYGGGAWPAGYNPANNSLYGTFASNMGGGGKQRNLPPPGVGASSRSPDGRGTGGSRPLPPNLPPGGVNSQQEMSGGL